MNRLKNTRGYLCGGMEFADGLGVDWRRNIIDATKDFGIIWMDPTNKPIDIGIEDLENHELRKKLKSQGNWERVASDMRTIRCVDLRMVDICDFMVVYIDTSIHTCGTYEELFLANRQKKPIIVRIKQGKEHCPDWLLGTLPDEMIFSSWDNVIRYLCRVQSGSLTPHKRWYFFNFNN